MRNFHVQRLFQAATEATQYIAAKIIHNTDAI